MKKDQPMGNFKPYLTSLIGGKKYAWCACGKSENQPFCDGSHKGSNINPIVFKSEKNAEVLLCTCKATKSPPYCDGSHNNLEDTYAEASEEEIEKFSNAELTLKKKNKAPLDGGAYVFTPNLEDSKKYDGFYYQALISREDGAEHLSFYKFNVASGSSPSISVEEADTVLFVWKGRGLLKIGPRNFELEPETGVFIKPGEVFTLEAEEPFEIFAAICPHGEIKFERGKSLLEFDESIPDRLVHVDHSKASVMADRFFQILVGGEVGSHEVTQFLGEVPKSRAAMHKHLYEEAIVVLSGEGVMWTETKKTIVQSGDVIFLPKRQGHSLECTNEKGLRLMGVFYPSGSPAINY